MSSVRHHDPRAARQGRAATAGPAAARLRRLVPPVALAAGAAALGLAVGAPGAGAEPSALALQRQRVRTLEVQVAALDARASAAERAYSGARSLLLTLRRRIHDNQHQLVRARRDQHIAQRRLANRLVAMYREPEPTVVDAILTTGSISDAIGTWTTLQEVEELDQETVRGIVANRHRITAIRVQLLADRRSARVQVAVAARNVVIAERVRGERHRVLAGARQQLAEFIMAEQRREAAFAAAQAAARAAAARPTTPAPSLGGSAGGSGGAGGSQPAPAATTGGVSTGVLERIAQCESGGNPTAVSPSGEYRGKYQFDPGTWHRLGGSGDPARAPAGEQDRLAAKLYAQSGPSAWPVCGRFAR